MIESKKVSHLSAVLLLFLFVNSSFLLLVTTALRVSVNFTNIPSREESFEGAFLYRPWTEVVNQSYVLGFVSRRETSGQYSSFFLSIWFFLPVGNSSEVVWIANREQSVGEGATVNFTVNGSLILHGSDGRQVWSTNTDGRGARSVEMNTTIGNLSVLGAHDHQPLWQSFDHPSSVLLQGATLKAGSQLVSDASPDDFSRGKYSLTTDPAGMVLRIFSEDGGGSQAYWMWEYYKYGSSNFSVSPSETCPTTSLLFNSGILKFQVNKGSDISHFCNAAVVKQDPIRTNTSAIQPNLPRILKLDSDGSLRVHVYNMTKFTDYDFFPSGEKCDLPELCGPYGVCDSETGNCSGCPVSDQSGMVAGDLFSAVSGAGNGCSVKGGTDFCNSTLPGYDTHLVKVRRINYYSNKFNPPDSVNGTANDCRNLCDKKCSCTASFFDEDNRTCHLVTDQIKSLQNASRLNVLAFVKVFGAPELETPDLVVTSEEPSNLPLMLGLCVPGVFLALLTLIVVICCRERHRRRKSQDDAFFKSLPGLPRRFTMRELQVATSGFSYRLGCGGFGAVYEGVLPDGTKVAVKKLKSAKQGRTDFRAEVETIGRIDHINLVRLRGFCADGYDNLLVYEFMPNGSLDTWLFNEDPTSQSQKLLPWCVRFKIALGTARGLAYLHEDLKDRIIHLDIKPQNILLDEKFVPKVADFGLAKLVDREQDQSLLETPVRGTPGYLAPEWQLQSGVSEKCDVYSYGMVLLELVTGCRNLDIRSVDSQRRYLPAWALRELEEGRAMDIVDKRLGGDFDQEKALRAVHIAFLCIHEDVDMRPTMGNVVQMLEGRAEVPEIDNLNVEFADVRHNLYSRSLTSMKSESFSFSDTDSFDMTLLPNMVVYDAR